MPSVGFEPTISAEERQQTYSLGRAATVTDNKYILHFLNFFFTSCITSLNFYPLCVMTSRPEHMANFSLFKLLMCSLSFPASFTQLFYIFRISNSYFELGLCVLFTCKFLRLQTLLVQHCFFNMPRCNTEDTEVKVDVTVPRMNV
jgi:hypothetical protein